VTYHQRVPFNDDCESHTPVTNAQAPTLPLALEALYVALSSLSVAIDSLEKAID